VPQARGYSHCRAALTVFAISIAMVIGPTPPGTGVIALAFFDYFVKCDIAHQAITAFACCVFHAVDSYVDDDGAFAHVISLHKFRSPNRRDNNVCRAK
jgi:hypothetical protein